MGFYGGDSCIIDHQRKGMGLVSHREIEWRLVGDGVRMVIVGKFCI